MDKQGSITSLMSAYVRAYHHEVSHNHVFDDFVARKLLSDDEYESIGKYIADGAAFFLPDADPHADREGLLKQIINRQLAPTPLARAAYCEEALETAILTGVTQYVILGAGLDTFAFRKPELLRQLTVFEVDHPSTQTDKRQRIARAGLAMPDALRMIPTDFRFDDLCETLTAGGFDVKQKTFFSWLGVSYYLSREDILRLLNQLADVAAEGSTLLFDYPDAGLFTSDDARVCHMLQMAEAGGEPMRFSSDELALSTMLEEKHFLIYEHLTPDEIQETYFDGRTDGLCVFPDVCFATAVYKPSQFTNTKEKILQTALHLFAQNGYDAVSVKDIADRLSLTKGALYRHYRSKRDIFDSILSRMEKADATQAEAYALPDGTADEQSGAYRNTTLCDIKAFTEAQFRYWTEDTFASDFRRMLTLEQYRSPEMRALYGQYLSDGPLGYTRELFCHLTSNETEAEKQALLFYAPVFLLYSLYDTAENKSDVRRKLHTHIEDFTLD